MITLRPYQAEAVAAIEKAAGAGVQRPLLALPTGTGKTIVFADLIKKRQGRALILAHRDELLQQAKDKLLPEICLTSLILLALTLMYLTKSLWVH